MGYGLEVDWVGAVRRGSIDVVSAYACGSIDVVSAYACATDTFALQYPAHLAFSITNDSSHTSRTFLL